MKILATPALIVNNCRLLYIRKLIPSHLNIPTFFLKSGKTINNLSCSFFLLLFCYSNFCTANYKNLAEALKTGDEKMIEQLMQKENIGMNDQIKWSDNCYVCLMTPLMWLAKYGHTHIAENFIKKGADVNAKNSDGSTALMFAADQGHTETVTLLLDHKANINEENIEGCTPLTNAISKEYIETAIYLINSGADIHFQSRVFNVTPLMLAAAKGLLQIVDFLVQRGANVNACNNENCTPLIYAVSARYIKTAIYLMNHGADVNVQGGTCRQTSVIIAALWERTDIIAHLIERSADINKQDITGCTALMWAIYYDYTETTKYLIAVGTDVNIEDFECRTALTCFMVHGKKDFIHIINLLISKGADFDISNPVHARSLCKAFKRFCQEPQKSLCQFDILKVLLDFIKPNETNNFVVKTFSSRKRSFLFQQKIDDKINEDILIEDLSALKVESISGSPLQDAAKYIIQKATTPIN